MVGDLDQVVEPVRDVDNGDARVTQPPDRAKSSSACSAGSDAVGSSRMSRPAASSPQPCSARAIATWVRCSGVISSTRRVTSMSVEPDPGQSSRVKRSCAGQSTRPANPGCSPSPERRCRGCSVCDTRPRCWCTARTWIGAPSSGAGPMRVKVRRRPSTRTREPVSGSWNPVSTLMRVDLPAPVLAQEGVHLAGAQHQVTSFKARVPGKVFERFSMVTKGATARCHPAPEAPAESISVAIRTLLRLHTGRFGRHSETNSYP